MRNSHNVAAWCALAFRYAFELKTYTTTTQAYISLLSLLSLIASPSLRRTTSTHVGILLLVVFAVYFYRDIRPLATFSLQPVDARDGGLLWALITVLAVIAIVIPLVKPRQYVPADPQVCLCFAFLVCFRTMSRSLTTLSLRIPALT